MSSNSSVEPSKATPDMSGAVAKRMRQVIAQFLLVPVILFVASGRIRWLWAWAYLGVSVCILAVNSRVMPRELIAERGQPRENVKSWDRTIAALIGLPALGMLIVAGLDKRFAWSPQLAPAIHLSALAFFALGQGLFTWAMVSNKFFSTAVRIQMDRGHTVATGGPYRYVRHPGYVGYIVFTLATALTLGSLWALIPAAISTCLLVLRTALEDRTLLDELEGYKDYAQRVRYRMVPGIW